MAIPKKYRAAEAEIACIQLWSVNGVYAFDQDGQVEVYSIDTPPATVSGKLHLGHVYSYSHADFFARYKRMKGYRVFYPMGYDDNGLPTERLVERLEGIRASQVGRQAFIEACLKAGDQAAQEYQQLWQRLGLSIDWRYTYRTIGEAARRISQWSFIDLYRKGRLYRAKLPTIFCPHCQTSIAQAEVQDIEEDSEYVTIPFSAEDGSLIPIATTRPELLAACVAVFIHPDDPRQDRLGGKRLITPHYQASVPLLVDPAVERDKGTGLVMCCTFGDAADVNWWKAHALPRVDLIDRQGRLTEAGGAYQGMTIQEARQAIKNDLQRSNLIISRQPTRHTLRTHERCDTPVEYRVSDQWFVRLLDQQEQWLQAGEQIGWTPETMHTRYRDWVENLNSDWCISRQRAYGVPVPAWYCNHCGDVSLPDVQQLPVDPLVDRPAQPCSCGSTDFLPDPDILDTWATSSLTPQIVGQWQADGENQLYDQVFPFSLRPQGHEIIRTWAFYTVVQSHDHFQALPWERVLISGWGIAGEGMGKISKSKGGGPLPPLEMIGRYSADAVRYWAASSAPGKNAIISEEKIQLGEKLVTKLWNVARLCEPVITGVAQLTLPDSSRLTAADAWILSTCQSLIHRVSALLDQYEYAAAKSEIETFFWREFADNYLEMCKLRLYNPTHPQYEGACFAIQQVFGTLLKLLAPFLPFVTETLYQYLYAAPGESDHPAPAEDGLSTVNNLHSSIHTSSWPIPQPSLEDARLLDFGELLIQLTAAVRRYKSERSLGLGSELPAIEIICAQPEIHSLLDRALPDLLSVSRARSINIQEDASVKQDLIQVTPHVAIIISA